MSNYQQQFYPPTAPSTSGGTPVSSFYSARQRFEQMSQPANSMPPHLRPSAYGYQQHSAPPKHPAQQARSAGVQSQPGHPGPSQPTTHQQHARPQSQYGQVQHPYQPPYSQQRTQGPAQVQHQPPQPMHAPAPSQYAPSVRPRSEYGPSLYAQSMQGYSPFPMLSGSQPTPARAFALYEAYNARQLQREAAAATQQRQSQGQPQPQPQPQQQAQPQTQHLPRNQPQISYQPPQPLRQSQQYPTQQYQASQIPSYAPSFARTEHPISHQQTTPSQVSPSYSSPPAPAPAPDFIPAPMAPVPQPQSQPGPQTYNQPQPQPQTLQRTPTTGSRRPLPQPGQARPRPMSMPPQAQPPGSTFQINVQRSSASNIPPQSPGRPVTIINYPSTPLEKPPVSPNSSVIPFSNGPLPPFPKFSVQEKIQPERTQTPEQVPPYSEKVADTTPTQRRTLPQSLTGPPDLSRLEKGRSVLNTESTPFQAAKSIASQSSSPHISPKTPVSKLPTNSEVQEDDDRLSVKSRESKQSGQRSPSPQYGILDLPKRNPSVFGGTAKSVTASPKYGIKDLPTRTKSVVDRRKAWERAEQGMNKAVAHTRTTLKSASSTRHAVPKSSASAPPCTAPVPTPSPQPQVPQQQQKLPMPVVRQPQPSRTERTPSWTLPTADLEKIAVTSEPKTSMALRLAKISLEEEKASSKRTASQPAAVQSQRSSVQDSSKAQSAPPTKSYPFANRTPRRSSTIDLNLDDAPPPSLRRTPSPSFSNSSSSVPSIPSIKTPRDVPQVLIPQINLPGGLDFDDVFTKPASPQKPSVPIINLPGDDDADCSGPVISISVPQNIRSDVVAMPVILDDLANSTGGTKSRGLPRPPSSSASSVTAVSSSGSNVRSRGGGLVCGGCGRSIIGRIVSAMGLRWHPQCFKCCQCGEQLEHVSSYEHNGKPYCHLDYHELFAPQCYSCKTPIIDERFITLDDPALGKRTYHEQHFFCAECGDPFLAPSTGSTNRTGPNEISIKGDGAFDVALDEDGLEVGFTVFRGHPYCEACHVRLRAPKCKACKRSIRDGMRAVEALGGKWCFECFICAGCQKPFEEPSFFQRDKKPFCEHCFSIILRNEV